MRFLIIFIILHVILFLIEAYRFYKFKQNFFVKSQFSNLNYFLNNELLDITCAILGLDIGLICIFICACCINFIIDGNFLLWIV